MEQNRDSSPILLAQYFKWKRTNLSLAALGALVQDFSAPEAIAWKLDCDFFLQGSAQANFFLWRSATWRSVLVK